MIAACKIIVIDHVEIRLAPTLRAGIVLDRQFGGLHKLALAVASGSLSSAVAIIRQHHDVPGLEDKVLRVLPTLTYPLLEYLEMLKSTPEGRPKGGEKITFSEYSEYFEYLFKIACGWLGWDSETALATSPYEIALAIDGRIELLQAIFGKADKPKQDDAPLEAKWRRAMSVLGTVKPYAQAA